MDKKYKYTIDPDSPGWPEFIKPTQIPGLLVYQRSTNRDNRGFFREAVELRDLEKVLGRKIAIKQWNHSQSHPNVIRGFHAEPWDKLIYVVKGSVMAVIVDLRIDSPSFGKVVKVTLGENDPKTLYLPEGMGNSFCNIGKDDSEYLYLITGYYEGKPTPAVSWQDPLLIRQFGGWPVKNPIVSDKDMSYPTLKEKFGAIVDFTKFPWLAD